MAQTALKCFVVLLMFVCAGCSFSPDRTKFIDQSRNKLVWIFRGSEPLFSNKTFCYEDLVASFRAQRPDLPSKFFLIDYNLLSYELGDKSAEKEFFAQNPDKGKYINDPIIGALSNPADFPEWIRKVMAIDMGGLDDIPATMQALFGLLNSNSSAPSVVYIHCEAGKDRTGEVSGSYYITYKNWTFNQALWYDNHCVEGSRDITSFSKNGLQWYCYYLHYTTMPSLDCQIDSQFVGTCTPPSR